MSGKACRCRNGRGGSKVQHETRMAAVMAAASPRYLRGGMAHEAYPCPTAPGVWHLRTVKRRR